MCAPEPGMRREPLLRGRQRGMSIVELMVAMVVSLLVGMAATGAAISFSAAQRQGIAAGGVAVNINTALASIKNDVAQAGLGFFGETQYLCATMDMSRLGTVHMNAANFVPVQVRRDLPNDRLDVFFGSRVEAGANVLTRGASNGSSVFLESYLPVAANEAVVLAPAQSSAGPCLLRTVTEVAAATADAPQALTFAGTGDFNQGSFTTAPTFPERSRVALLGEFTWNRYRLDGSNLIMERPMTGDSAIIARNVLAFRVQYGVSSGLPGANSLEEWTDAEGVDFAALNAGTLSRVRAVRIALVSRAPAKEKPDVHGFCDATSSKPVLWGETVEPDVTDWECYRYRTSVVVVPMRNVVVGMRP